MAISNRDRLTKALDLLRDGLAPYVEREFRAKYPNVAQKKAVELFGDDRAVVNKEIRDWDVHALLKVMREGWQLVFARTLGPAERTWVMELTTVRNDWAHQKAYSSDDTDRALDTMQRLLSSCSAWQAESINKMKQELRRQVYDEQVRGQARKGGGTLLDLAYTGTLKPWRELVSPHPDVASGRYLQAEFAADLWQVHQGEGSDEYRAPVEFFRRTYLTASLKALLISAVQRLSGMGGHPVVQLQTNFGGGKTHSMLALYHLFSGKAKAAELLGVDTIMAEAGIEELPVARTVVLVGNKISPGNPSIKTDGTEVRTLWGELAWQLGGRDAYNRVANDDRLATNPGDTLKQLFNQYGPALVLIDEWVAYARQLHDNRDLPGGDFETQFTFAQALTEAARDAKHCLLLISLPASDTATTLHAEASDVEVGGSRGREALERLHNVIKRVDNPWNPATPEESFEIVRRRLFQPLPDNEAYRQRDVTARAFAELYRASQGEFPSECRTVEYESRISAAFPIHPELFDRLYGDWSTLVSFQRTRGVLRLMAAVINSLWERGERSPLIMPSSVPLDDPRVANELTRYLSDNWKPILETDIDGPASTPFKLDQEFPNLGRLAAARRVARTVFLGSAPAASASQRGLEDKRVKLGCAMPSENISTFADALGYLSRRATYLYNDGARAWYATKPTVTKLADDRAEEIRRRPDMVAAAMAARVKDAVAQRGDFARVHALPQGPAEVPDDQEVRLVVLPPAASHNRTGESRAQVEAQRILEQRGTQPRIFRNTLVFLAADPARLQDLEMALCRFQAWRSILDEKNALNLDPLQVKQAETMLQQADGAVAGQLAETYCWLLSPVQESPQAAVTWKADKLTGADPLAVRAAKRLVRDEGLVKELGANILRARLDGVPLWRGNHVAVKQLVDDFATYLYLERVQRPAVVTTALAEAVKLMTWQVDGVAYAGSWDGSTERYTGLQAGQVVHITPDSPGVVVRGEVAWAQMEAERPERERLEWERLERERLERERLERERQEWKLREEERRKKEGDKYKPKPYPKDKDDPPPPSSFKRFHASALLSPLRMGSEAGAISEDIVTRLDLAGIKVEVTLDIKATSSTPISQDLVDAILAKCVQLKFGNHGFEAE